MNRSSDQQDNSLALFTGRRTRSIFVAVVIVSMIAITTGCRARNAAYRRETALLRAEILDLEDQLYALKAQMKVVPARADMPLDTFYTPPLEGEVIDMGDCCSPGDIVYESPLYSGDIFVDGSSVQSGQMTGQPVLRGQPMVPARSFPEGAAPLVEPEDIEGRPVDRGSSPTQVSPQTNPIDEILNQNGGIDNSTGRPEGGNHGGDYLQDFNQDVFVDPVEIESTGPEPAYERPLARDYQPVDVGFQRNGSNINSLSADTVTEIYIDPAVTRGVNVDRIRGDEGVEVLLQPRNATGGVVSQSGQIAVSLIDPVADSVSRRLGMWEFSGEEIELFAVNKSGQTAGYLLHLPWELSRPSDNRLIVFVRYITPDGRRLETSHEMRIVPPASDYSPRNPAVEAWTRSDPRWNGGIDSGEDGNSLIADRDSNEQWMQQRRGTGVPALPASSSDDIRRPRWRPIR